MSYMFLECKSIESLPFAYILDKFINTIFFKLKYKNKEKNKVKILGKEFIENNNDKGGIIYNNNCEIKLQEYFEDINNKKDEIILYLYLDKNIEDISYFFNECDSLISVEYYQINQQLNENNSKISDNNDTSNSFYNENNIKSLSQASSVSNQKKIKSFSGYNDLQPLKIVCIFLMVVNHY